MIRPDRGTPGGRSRHGLRHEEERGPTTLRATPLAYSAPGIAEDESPARNAQASDQSPAPAPETHVRRKTSKQALLIDMLKAHGARFDRRRAQEEDWPQRPF